MKIIRPKMCKYQMRDVMLINNSRKVFIKFGIYFILLGVAVLIALLPNVVSTKKNVVHRQARFAIDLKYILFWKQAKRNKKNFFNKDEIYAQGQRELITQNCPQINCFLTYNKSLLQTADNFDAIVFNIHDIKKLKPYNVNLGRSPHQKFIFKSLESSQNYPICNHRLDNFFNWTWSYRLDSDVPQPFISILDTKKHLVGPRNNIKWSNNIKKTDKFKDKIKSKTKAVAWFVRHCKLKNKHHDFVKDLRKELKGYNYTLDTLGPCSDNKKCAKGKQGSEICFKQIEKDYYFQLVLEDSVTQDYVTEIIAKAMSHFSVPIVLGSNFSSFLPPGSFINAGTFDFKKLGAVIDYLIRNPKKYSYFFDWKNYYYYTPRPRTSICDLCTKLNEYSRPKTYSNFRRWWNKDYEDECEGNNLYNKFKEV